MSSQPKLDFKAFTLAFVDAFLSGKTHGNFTKAKLVALTYIAFHLCTAYERIAQGESIDQALSKALEDMTSNFNELEQGVDKCSVH